MFENSETIFHNYETMRIVSNCVELCHFVSLCVTLCHTLCHFVTHFVTTLYHFVTAKKNIETCVYNPLRYIYIFHISLLMLEKI